MSKKNHEFINNAYSYKPFRERDHPSRPNKEEKFLISDEIVIMYLRAMCMFKFCKIEYFKTIKNRDDFFSLELKETYEKYKNQFSFKELFLIEKNLKKTPFVKKENFIEAFNNQLFLLRQTFNQIVFNKVEPGKRKSFQNKFSTLFSELEKNYKVEKIKFYG
jgi:hypothetical protein